MALVKRCQRHWTKPSVPKECTGFDAIVVYANHFVGVSDSDVESEIVVECGGEVEQCKWGVSDMDLNLAGVEDEEHKGYSDNS